MIIFIDEDYKCHISNNGSYRPIETEYCNGLSDKIIEGYRLVPAGETWVREDGAKFTGEMFTPWKPYNELLEIQAKIDHEIAQTVAKAGIIIEPKPLNLPNKPGYEWIPIQAAGGSIIWVLSDNYNSELPGTKENPLDFNEETEVLQNYYYINKNEIKLWFGKQKVQTTWDDDNWISLNEI